jgi:hypothetical protein
MNDNAKRWIEALKSGKYFQGQGVLHQRKNAYNLFCCLGLACHLYQEASGDLDVKVNNLGGYSYDGDTVYLPPAVRDWLGLNDCTGNIDGEAGLTVQSLTYINDNGWTFAEIAEFIEEHESEVFKS